MIAACNLADEATRRALFRCTRPTCDGALFRPPYARNLVNCYCWGAALYPERISAAAATASDGDAASPNTVRTDAHANRNASCVSMAASTTPAGGLSPDCNRANARSNSSLMSIAHPTQPEMGRTIVTSQASRHEP